MLRKPGWIIGDSSKKATAFSVSKILIPASLPFRLECVLDSVWVLLETFWMALGCAGLQRTTGVAVERAIRGWALESLGAAVECLWSASSCENHPYRNDYHLHGHRDWHTCACTIPKHIHQATPFFSADRPCRLRYRWLTFMNLEMTISLISRGHKGPCTDPSLLTHI